MWAAGSVPGSEPSRLRRRLRRSTPAARSSAPGSSASCPCRSRRSPECHRLRALAESPRLHRCRLDEARRGQAVLQRLRNSEVRKVKGRSLGLCNDAAQPASARGSRLIQESMSSTSIPLFVAGRESVCSDAHVRVRTISVMDSEFQQGFGSLQVQRVSNRGPRRANSLGWLCCCCTARPVR